jgi:GT2 family glycosyltransferase
MSHPLLSAVIINYNGKHQLESCLESLFKQTQKNLEIIYIDNNSADGSNDLIKTKYPQILSVFNQQNTGYAGGANQGIGMAKGDYIILMNPDIIFEPDYTEKCLAKMEADKKIASITGKIYKYDFEKKQKTRVIDTVGLFCFRNRRIIDDGQGIEDKGQFDRPKEIFGVSGSCPIYRKSALMDVKVFDDFLDSDFFMYKEDVDLAWRFRLLGWKSYYLPSAAAYHGRGTGVLKRFSHIEVYKNRGKLNKFQKYHSYKNQRWMQIKNEFVFGVLRDFFPIICKEFLIFGYMIFKEPFLFKALGEMLIKLPRFLKKRNYIMMHRRVGRKEMQKWFCCNNSQYLQDENSGNKSA